MTQIVGIIRSPAGVISAAKLRVTLQGDILDRSTDPDTLVAVSTSDTFDIVNGVLNIDIPESATSNVTYFFELFTEFQVEQFFFLNGESYTGPTHLHTDGLYYTGDSQTSESVQLLRVIEQEELLLNSFYEVVPNVSVIEFTELVPTGISVGSTIRSTGAYRIAQILTSEPTFIDALKANIRWQGDYNPTTLYTLGDVVKYAGSSWLYINPLDQVGIIPVEGSTWGQLADKGDPGGTGGDNTAYDPNGWLNDLNAPSKNTIRNLVENELARQSSLIGLAPSTNPTFLGSVNVPDLALTNFSQNAANSKFVVDKINELIAPLQPVFFRAEKGGAVPVSSTIWTPLTNYTAQTSDDTNVLNISTGHFAPGVTSVWWLGALVNLRAVSSTGRVTFGARLREVTTNEIYLLKLDYASLAPDQRIAFTVDTMTDALPGTSEWVFEIYFASDGALAIEPESGSKPTAFYGQKVRNI